MSVEYKAYYTDVQKVIDNLQKMNGVLESRILEEAMRMLEVLSSQVKAYSDELEYYNNQANA